MGVQNIYANLKKGQSKGPIIPTMVNIWSKSPPLWVCLHVRITSPTFLITTVDVASRTFLEDVLLHESDRIRAIKQIIGLGNVHVHLASVSLLCDDFRVNVRRA